MTQKEIDEQFYERLDRNNRIHLNNLKRIERQELLSGLFLAVVVATAFLVPVIRSFWR